MRIVGTTLPDCYDLPEHSADPVGSIARGGGSEMRVGFQQQGAAVAVPEPLGDRMHGDAEP